jgi:hypothetical protein
MVLTVPVSLSALVSIWINVRRFSSPIPPLGLNPERYRSSNSAESEETAFSTLDSQISDTDRFKDSTPFLVRCRRCQGQVPFEPIFKRDVRPPLIYTYRWTNTLYA